LNKFYHARSAVYGSCIWAFGGRSQWVALRGWKISISTDVRSGNQAQHVETNDYRILAVNQSIEICEFEGGLVMVSQDYGATILACSQHPGLRLPASDEPHSSNIIVESTMRKESSSTGDHFASKEGNFIASCSDGHCRVVNCV
jgi:hypothetical protein